MNNDYVIERVFYYILMVLIPLVSFYIGKHINFGKKSDSKLNFYLACLYASIICLIIILFYSLLRELFDIDLKILNVLSIVFFPLSILSGLFFAIVYTIRKIKVKKAIR